MQINTSPTKASIGTYTSLENIMSFKLGNSEFLSITFSRPLPIDTAKNICGIIPIKEAKKKFFTFTLKIVGRRQLSCHGIPPTNRYINKYINSEFLNLISRFLNLLRNFSLIISFKKKFPNAYNMVAPILKPNTTTIVPIHFPKIKPPKSAIGDPNPKKGNTHNIVISKQIIKPKSK